MFRYHPLYVYAFRHLKINLHYKRCILLSSYEYGWCTLCIRKDDLSRYRRALKIACDDSKHFNLVFSSIIIIVVSENRGWTNGDRVTEGFHTPAIILSIDFMIRLWTEKDKRSMVNYSYSNCSISCSLWYTSHIIISNIVRDVYTILI